MEIRKATKLIIVVCVLACLTGEAQPIRRAAKTETANTVKSRKLVVLLRSEDEVVTRKLNPQELKKYKQSITDLNNNFEFAVKNFWKFNTSVSYLTKDKISSLPGQPNEYTVLSLDVINIRLANQINRGPANQIVRLHICLLEDYDPLKPVYYQEIVGLVTDQSVPSISKTDLIAATHMVQNHLEARSEGKTRSNGFFYEEAIEHAGTLQSKILLIDTIYMDKNLTSSVIKETYDYPFEISNAKAIEKAQMSRDKKYAYVYLFPTTGAAIVFYHCILDCETGKSISYSVQSGFHQNNLIDKKHLEQYVLYSDYYKNKKNKKAK